MLWLLSHPEVSGLFNVGTGQARSFRDLVTAMLAALGRAPHIVDMPPSIRNTYRYFIQASMQRLQQTGCNLGFTRLEDAVRNYVISYLDTATAIDNVTWCPIQCPVPYSVSKTTREP